MSKRMRDSSQAEESDGKLKHHAAPIKVASLYSRCLTALSEAPYSHLERVLPGVPRIILGDVLLRLSPGLLYELGNTLSPRVMESLPMDWMWRHHCVQDFRLAERSFQMSDSLEARIGALPKARALVSYGAGFGRLNVRTGAAAVSCGTSPPGTDAGLATMQLLSSSSRWWSEYCARVSNCILIICANQRQSYHGLFYSDALDLLDVMFLPLQSMAGGASLCSQLRVRMEDVVLSADSPEECLPYGAEEAKELQKWITGMCVQWAAHPVWEPLLMLAGQVTRDPLDKRVMWPLLSLWAERLLPRSHTLCLRDGMCTPDTSWLCPPSPRVASFDVRREPPVVNQCFPSLHAVAINTVGGGLRCTPPLLKMLSSVRVVRLGTLSVPPEVVRAVLSSYCSLEIDVSSPSEAFTDCFIEALKCFRHHQTDGASGSSSKLMQESKDNQPGDHSVMSSFELSLKGPVLPTRKARQDFINAFGFQAIRRDFESGTDEQPPQLSVLSLQDIQLLSTDVALMASSWCRFVVSSISCCQPGLRALDLSRNLVGPIATNDICMLVHTLPALVSLRLDQTGVNASVLCRSLASDTRDGGLKLQVISLNRVKCGFDDLALLLKNVAALKSLSAEGAMLLSAYRSTGSALRDHTVHRHWLEFADQVSTHPRLVELNLAANQLAHIQPSVEGASLLIRKILEHRVLSKSPMEPFRVLDLSGNLLKSQILCELADTLLKMSQDSQKKMACMIETLDFSRNLLGDMVGATEHVVDAFASQVISASPLVGWVETGQPITRTGHGPIASDGIAATSWGERQARAWHVRDA